MYDHRAQNPLQTRDGQLRLQEKQNKRSGAEVATRGARHDRAPNITRGYFYYLDKAQNLVVRENGCCQKIVTCVAKNLRCHFSTYSTRGWCNP